MKPSSSHLPSLFGSLLFLLGAALGLGAALLLGVVALSRFFIGGSFDARETIVLTVVAFEGVLLLVAAVISFQKFLQKPSADSDVSYTISAWQIGILVILAGLAILLGHQVYENQSVNWVLLPLLTIPAVFLPILILLGLGVRRLHLGTRWLAWNVLGISMTLVPFILFLVEIIALFLILILAGIFAVSQPQIVAEMDRLVTQIYMLGPGPDPEVLMELVAPFVLKPGVIGITLLYIAVLVPLLEEAIKPLGVWLFGNQLNSQAQGFALGALSGAAYALIETLGVSPQTTDWSTLLLTRVGTGLLHVTTSALMGGAISFAIRERRYLRLLGTYILAASLHGLWNASAVFYTFSTMAESLEQSVSFARLSQPIAVGMTLLSVGLLVILVVSNRRMRNNGPIVISEEPAV
ncbi:MAG TPA: PrsW family glutamic-type intramembrane protease [Anaerolineales bacterium]|nr:PrsW family glutamic-type intramembrane protease [Anaerolineales bacterium]